MTAIPRRERLAPFIYGTVGVVLFLLAWQWGSTRVASSDTLPSVPAVVTAWAEMMGTPRFWTDVGATLGVALLGWAVAAVVGVVLGVLIGTSRVIASATRVPFEFLRPIPAIVILPLAILIFGPTAEMGVFLVIFGVTLPIVAQTTAGVESVDPVMRNTARSFGMSRVEILWRVVIPGASPYIGTAMRVAAPVTLIMSVVAGMLGGAPGIGASLTTAQIVGNSNAIFAYVLTLGFLGLVVQTASVQIERRLLHWHSAYRKGQ